MEGDNPAGHSALDRLLSDVQDVDSAIDRAALGSRVGGLPEDEQRILLLTYRDGLSLREVADVLGVDEDEVRRRQTAAVLRLRSGNQG